MKHMCMVLQVSAASVLTIEQIAALLARDELQVGYNVSKAVMRQLVDPEGGDVLTKVQDAAWLTGAMSSAAETTELPAPDAALAQAVADSIVLINARLVEVRDTVGTDDSEQLLTGWAKTAYVGDVLFSENAAKLGSGDMDETEFRCNFRSDLPVSRMVFCMLIATIVWSTSRW